MKMLGLFESQTEEDEFLAKNISQCFLTKIS